MTQYEPIAETWIDIPGLLGRGYRTFLFGKEWFFVPGDLPRDDKSLSDQFQACRAQGVNSILDVTPETTGQIPQEFVQALPRLRKNVGI